MKNFTKMIYVLLCGSYTICFSQNYIDKYLTDPLVFTNIATSADGINQPRDLDFKPNSMELWVVNYGNNQGGTNVIIYNAGLPNQSSQLKKDSHSGHFLMYPSAIAFSDIGEWGSASEIKNTANAASTFMGPGLWSADTNIFAKVFQNNWQTGFPLGSHIDMLHQSPFSMGIAHETGKTYWVSDGWNGNLCKYDFVMDHGPGYDTHSAGKIWRHTDVSILRAVGIPGHMVMDKVSKWLYIVDAGNKKIFRVNTNTGTIGGNLVAPNEPLATYKSVTGATQQTIDTYTSQPCGIDYVNDRLIVGDYATGDIKVYNTSGATPTLMGTIATGQPGIMGLKIGYDGKIWFVNKTLNTVVRIDPSTASNDASVTEIISPAVINFEGNYHSPAYDVCGSSITPVVKVQNMGSNILTSLTVAYKVDGGSVTTYAWAGSISPNAVVTVTLPSSSVTNDKHKLEVYTSNPNGSADGNPLNDKKEGGFRSKDPLVSLPYLEDFSLTTFPPAGWSYIGFNKFCPMSRESSIGGFGSNDGCLKMDNTSGAVDISGQTDFFLSPRFDLTSSGPGTNLEFDVAYAQYSNSSNDKLNVKVSVDCGISWTSVYNKGGSPLSTASPSNSIFYPEAWEWRTDTVNLDAYLGQEILLLFTATSNFGNNLYLDNIKINHVSTVGVKEEEKNSSVILFPNPSTGILTIRSSDESISNVELYDVLGQNLKDGLTIRAQGGKTIVDMSDQPSGTYFIKMKTEKGSVVRKVILQDE